MSFDMSFKNALPVVVGSFAAGALVGVACSRYYAKTHNQTFPAAPASQREREAKIEEAKEALLRYTPDGPVARQIAAVTPYYAFKGIDRFYDIGGFLKNPAVFRLVVDAFVSRYQDMDIDTIGGFEARGLVLGPPVALALNKPFFMLRKKGKMPNAVTGSQYAKEYAGDDALCIPRGAVTTGQRVLLVDDLVATGGTLIAGIDLVQQFGGIVVECGCVVELKKLNARKRFADQGYGGIPIWGLVSEDILDLKGEVVLE